MALIWLRYLNTLPERLPVLILVFMASWQHLRLIAIPPKISILEVTNTVCFFIKVLILILAVIIHRKLLFPVRFWALPHITVLKLMLVMKIPISIFLVVGRFMHTKKQMQKTLVIKVQKFLLSVKQLILTVVNMV